MRTALVPKTETKKRFREISGGTPAGKNPAHSGASAGMPIFLQRMHIQPAVKINPASAAYEAEADRAAEATQSGGELSERPSLVTHSSGTIQEPSLADSAVRQGISGTRSQGSALPFSTRAAMQDNLGSDFIGAPL